MKCEKLTCEKTKTIIIAVLAVLCVFLALVNMMQWGTTDYSSSGQPAAITSTAVRSGVSNNGEKLNASSVIHKASIEGLSLETVVSDIDGLADSAGFSCEKSGDPVQNSTWNCKHDKLPDTTLRVTAINGKITEVYRNGSIAAEDLAPTLDMLDDLKFQLNTRENVRFNQSEDVFSFTVRTKTEAGDETLDYNIMNQRYREDGGDTIKTKQVYTAIISTPAVEPTAETTPPTETLAPSEITPVPSAAKVVTPEVSGAEEKSSEIKDTSVEKAPAEATPADNAQTPKATEEAPDDE